MNTQKKKNILVLTYWSYKDALIQTYTLPYVKLIRKHLPEDNSITIVTLEKTPIALTSKELQHLNNSFKKDNINFLTFRYASFGLMSFVNNFYFLCYLWSFIFIKKIAVIHAWCTPAGGIGFILSKLTGRTLILDSFEPHAEPMIESGTWKKNSLAFKILFTLEKLQAKQATITIGCVERMKDYAEQRLGVSLNNFYWKPACVDFSLFSLDKIKDKNLVKKYNLEDKIVCVYAGKFGGSYLKQEIFDLFKVAEDKWKDKFRVVLLNNDDDEKLKALAKNSGFDWNKLIKLFVPHSEVPKYMGLGDFAITPFKPVPSKRYGTPIKTGEYWALGLPIIITKNISDDSDIIEKRRIGAVISTLDRNGYVKVIEKINQLLSSNRAKIKEKIRATAMEFRNFQLADNIYKKIYSK